MTNVIKKILIFISIIMVFAVIYIFKSDNTLPSERIQVKFLSKDQVLEGDKVIKITENGFEPNNINIKKGQRVVWLNETERYVWPASDPHPTHGGYPGFDPTEPFKKEEAWAFVFEKSGIWSYHDHLKPGMKGEIEINE